MEIVEIRCESKPFNSAINVTIDVVSLVGDSPILENCDTAF